MRIPQNFNKIDGSQFTIGDDTFTIEVDNNEPGDLWVMHGGSRYPLCFDIDWQDEKYTLIKCRPGDGRYGTELSTDAILMKYLVKDANTFINVFVKDIVATLIKHNIL